MTSTKWREIYCYHWGNNNPYLTEWYLVHRNKICNQTVSPYFSCLDLQSIEPERKLTSEKISNSRNVNNFWVSLEYRRPCFTINWYRKEQNKTMNVSIFFNSHRQKIILHTASVKSLVKMTSCCSQPVHFNHDAFSNRKFLCDYYFSYEQNLEGKLLRSHFMV